MPWTEIDRERCAWVIDAARAKNDEDHLAPLNVLAMRELELLGWKRRGHVFSTNGRTPISGYSKMKRQLDRHMLSILQKMADERAAALGEEPEQVELDRWTLHDIRRTGTTQMQALGIPVEVSDRCLNHKDDESSRGSRKPYHLWKYEPEKRAAFEKWGAQLVRLTTAPGENIVTLKKSASAG
jgi:hypothetical protein